MDHKAAKWQTGMAPFMTWAVVATALFFAIVAIWKFNSIETRLSWQPVQPPSVDWSSTARPQTFDQQLALARTQAEYTLEREVLARRYNHAGIVFATRLWTGFMGFVTGMVLALVGAAFVLGKLDTDRNELEAETKGFSLTLRSASPGVILAVLGTTLMAMSIAVTATTITSESAVYFAPGTQSFDDIPPMPDSPPVNSAAPSEPEPERRRTK